MKLVAILRIKNEILHIEKCLARLEELVDEIVILDNGSTDGTIEVYPKFKKVVQVLETVGFDEGRDKIMLLEAAKARKPDWIMWLDGDELLERALARKQLEKYMASGVNKVAFRLVNFWMSEDKFRVDGRFFQYSLHPRVRLWRNVEGSYFRDRKIHNGEIEGVSGKIKISPFRLLHYGYIDRNKVLKKVELYNQVDKSGGRSYTHIEPDSRSVCLPYIEFSKPVLHRLFLLCNNSLLYIVYVLFRLFKKVSEMIEKVCIKITHKGDKI